MCPCEYEPSYVHMPGVLRGQILWTDSPQALYILGGLLHVFKLFFSICKIKIFFFLCGLVPTSNLLRFYDSGGGTRINHETMDIVDIVVGLKFDYIPRKESLGRSSSGEEEQMR